MCSRSPRSRPAARSGSAGSTSAAHQPGHARPGAPGRLGRCRGRVVVIRRSTGPVPGERAGRSWSGRSAGSTSDGWVPLRVAPLTAVRRLPVRSAAR